MLLLIIPKSNELELMSPDFSEEETGALIS